MTSLVTQTNAQPITIENHSFEQPGTNRRMDWKDVPGWNSDAPAAGSGVEQNAPSDGSWTAFLHRNDPSIWNLTGYTLHSSDEITLTFDTRNADGGRTLRASLYCDCSGSRVTVATRICRVAPITGAMQEFSLTFSAASRPDAIGRRLGVEFQTINGGVIGLDNVRLTNRPRIAACDPDPNDQTRNLPAPLTLKWSAPPGVSAPLTYNVYLGASPEKLECVSRRQTEESFTPSLSPGASYYWQVEIVEGDSVHPGDMWMFEALNPSDSIYFIDSESGSDENDGRAPDRAWASLTKINETVFQPGDRIFFKAGSRYSGQLKPSGSGAEGRPIIIDSYGSGGKPRIDAEGKFQAALSLINQDFWEISNLEITNQGHERQVQQRGALIVVDDGYGVMKHIHLKNLYVHDVTGSIVKAEGGGSGIHFYTRGDGARFDDLLVEGCYLVRCDRNGIDAWGDWVNPWRRWNPSTNVVWRGNVLEDIGGDCVLPIGFEGALIEGNVIRGGRTRAQDHAAGMWPWGCVNTVFQHNEVSGMRGTLDGQAYDCDYECSGTVFQYNYSHDNDGGFMLVTGDGAQDAGPRDSIIRYNISQNDGSGARIFHLSGGARNTRIYNNVIFSELDNTMVLIGDWNGWPDDTQFVNNIFYVTGKASYNFGQGTNTIFDSNVFFGAHVDAPADENALTSDPMLAAPGEGGDTHDELTAYQLLPGSPCIDSGKDVENSEGVDFWGNPAPDAAAQRTDRGAHETMK
ncbi:right-handed parallel beta-helix repeat-containing protein [Candidatus Sumerlaeota bacterium]|nr:right-handed parallel beta-helix repeat-containing protein [Candidatus Sumerlaeota bacterium]